MKELISLGGKVDEHVEGLFVFPSGFDLHDHPFVTGGKVILQDKASCLPANILLKDGKIWGDALDCCAG